jgi:3-hydroxybutyryl-CoA dehydrogenase
LLTFCAGKKLSEKSEMKVQVVGVVGAGVMGTGVAQSLAQTRHQVILLDVSAQVLNQSKAAIEKNLRFQRLFNRRSDSESQAEVLSRIEFSTNHRLLAEADFVIENVTEKWGIKKDLYQQLDAVCPLHTIYAANTSAIPITRIAAATKRAAQVLGMHFMNPVPLKPTVEVIRGYHTSEETLAVAKQLLGQMGKEGILVNDSPGFVSNRVLMLAINEAIWLLQDGVASAEDVDKIFETCLGHKMGPLATADLIGLDTILLSLEVLYDSFNDSKFRPCPLLRKMVDAGLHGQKRGVGFHRYLEN